MNQKEILKRIYPSVVTFAGDWQKMIKDVSRLKLKEISLFLTCAGIRERQQIYKALESSTVKQIPHVHLRHDMKEEEINYLASRYKARVFTVHFQHFEHFKKSKYRNQIFIESNDGQARIKNLSRLKQAGGICIDLSHMEQFRRLTPDYYRINDAITKKIKVGCNHLSAVKPNGQSRHYAKNTAELNYVATLPQYFFSDYINIELANSIARQLKFKKYLAKLLAKQWNKKP